MNKSLQKVIDKTKPAMAQEAALKALANSEMKEVLEEVDCNSSLDNTKDVTADFLAPMTRSEEDLDECPLFVYKGLIRKLESISGKETVEIGVLAGKEGRVLDVITASSVGSVMTNPFVIERWQKQDYKALGVVVWTESEPDAHKDLIEASGLEHPLLLMTFPLKPDRRAWLTQWNDGDISFKPVALCSQSNNRKKNDIYAVLPASRVGTSFEDQARVCTVLYSFHIAQATSAVHIEYEPSNVHTCSMLFSQEMYTNSEQAHCAVSEAVYKHIQQAAQERKKDRGPSRQYRIYSAPPDGLCCYHSILAGLRFEEWSEVARAPDGFAVNARVVEKESTNAKQLRQLALDSTDKRDQLMVEMSKSAQDRLTVDVLELTWLGKTLNLAIRCTIEAKAGWVKLNRILTALKTKQFCYNTILQEQRLTSTAQSHRAYSRVEYSTVGYCTVQSCNFILL